MVALFQRRQPALSAPFHGEALRRAWLADAPRRLAAGARATRSRLRELLPAELRGGGWRHVRRAQASRRSRRQDESRGGGVGASAPCRARRRRGACAKPACPHRRAGRIEICRSRHHPCRHAQRAAHSPPQRRRRCHSRDREPRYVRHRAARHAGQGRKRALRRSMLDPALASRQARPICHPILRRARFRCSGSRRGAC